MKLVVATLLMVSACVTTDAAPEPTGALGDPACHWLDAPVPDAIAVVRHGNAHCTGTLIESTTVLTAAHCTRDGVDDVDLAGVTHGVASVNELTNANYPTLDYAIITLASPSEATPLPIVRYTPGVLARVWGFGCGGFGGPPLARVLATPEGLWPWDQVEQTGMCLCPGDSGGPMVTDEGVVGFLIGTLVDEGESEPSPHGPHIFQYADTREF
jgi:hypothetical protein